MDPRDAHDEDAQERDLWWGAPSTRSMIPSFAVSVLLTAIIALGAWYMYHQQPGLVHWWRYGAYALGLVLWGQQLALWNYRTVFLNYRLTTCHLWRDSGIRRPSGAVIELTHIKEVRVEPPTRRERWLGIGRVIVKTDEANPREMVLFGLHEPAKVAEAIRTAARRAATQDGDECPPK
jgi:hypothetical protein